MPKRFCVEWATCAKPNRSARQAAQLRVAWRACRVAAAHPCTPGAQQDLRGCLAQRPHLGVCLLVCVCVHVCVTTIDPGSHPGLAGQRKHTRRQPSCAAGANAAGAVSGPVAVRPPPPRTSSRGRPTSCSYDYCKLRLTITMTILRCLTWPNPAAHCRQV